MSTKQGLLAHLDPVGAEAFHILLVEDDELTLKVTEGLLRKCDYQGNRHHTLHLLLKPACRGRPFEFRALLQSHWREMAERHSRPCNLRRASIST